MEFFLKTRVDVRRMHSSLKLQSCPLLNSQIVEQLAHIDHSVIADFCRASHVDADHQKRVRFEINVDNNNDKQQHNDETKGNHKRGFNKNGVGVGLCMSSVGFRD